MHVKIELIKPEMAKRWIDRQVEPRPINQKRVAKYARDMADGVWRLSNRGISIDPDGRLLDGLQRCAAIVAADVAVRMVVIYDVPPGPRSRFELRLVGPNPHELRRMHRIIFDDPNDPHDPQRPRR